MATVCAHDGTKMVANPYASRTDQFYCPKCGSGDEAAIYQYRRNGHKPAVVDERECTCADYPDGRSLVCPTCRDRAQRTTIPF